MSSKKKYIILSAVISSCLFSAGAYADDLRSDMPRGSGRCNAEGSCTKDTMRTDRSDLPGYRNPPNYVIEGGSGREYSGGKLLKTDSVEKIQGIVQSVNRVQYPNSTQIQLMVETDKGMVKVILGPASYVDRSKLKLQSGDKVVVKGYMVSGNGEEAMMASEVSKNGNVMQLRDANRQPIWGETSHSGNTQANGMPQGSSKYSPNRYEGNNYASSRYYQGSNYYRNY